jgi:pimeloyl-ACP methyl ester carboxylesterase
MKHHHNDNRLWSTHCVPHVARAALVFLALVSVCTVSAQPTADREETVEALIGSWTGYLEFGGQRITTVINLSRSGDSLIATMDSPDQGAFGIPVASTTVTGRRIELTISAVGARYEAILTDEGVLDGTFHQSGLALPLVMEKGGAEGPPEPERRPQDPSPPFPYEVDEMVFRNSADDIVLSGTITYPRGSGPFPAVVLVSGSGQQNRDEEIFNHRPFLVLADALTRAGIVVLRYDDRGVGGSGGLETLAAATTEDLARDAEAAVDALAARPGIDRNRIGVIGHSEGATIAAELAADRKVAFAVMIAGPGLPGHELMRLQWEALLRASGSNEAVIDIVIDVWGRVYDRVLEGGDAGRIAEDIRPILRELGPPPEQLEAQVQAVTTPYFLHFLRYDPRPTLRRIAVPMLAINGSLDTQVTATENLAAIEDALRAAPTRRFVVQELPGLNHLMQTAQTGSPQEYANIEETFAPVALETIVDWVGETVGR